MNRSVNIITQPTKEASYSLDLSGRILLKTSPGTRGSGKQFFSGFAAIGQFKGATVRGVFLERGIDAEAPGDRGIEIDYV